MSWQAGPFWPTKLAGWRASPTSLTHFDIPI